MIINIIFYLYCEYLNTYLEITENNIIKKPIINSCLIAYSYRFRKKNDLMKIVGSPCTLLYFNNSLKNKKILKNG